jgi:inner membrane protein
VDNITHAIAGVITAEAVVQLRRRLGHDVTPAWARAAWIVSALAHNAPDADAVYTGITGGPLGYLLHHRGHTHTLALAPPLAALSYLIGGRLSRGWRAFASRADRRWLAALALLGPVGHLLLDLSNDYGVHPFWPVENGWFYGDAIFIVEPLFWAVTLPVVVRAASSPVARGVWGLVLAAGLGLTWLSGYVPWPAALATTLVAVCSGLVAWRASPPVRIAAALGASLAVLAVFMAGSAAAARSVRAALSRAYPGWTTLDVARSPRPATPACWQAVAVQRSARGEYALRAAHASAWPALVSAAACGGAREETTAPLTRGAAAPERAVEIWGELERPVAELRRLSERCDVAAYLRWSRMPFALREPDGALVVGDLRYDRDADLDFAEARLPERAGECPEHVPPWRPPRADLLE